MDAVSEPTYDRLLVERDALKSECIRMMDEIATLKRQAEDVRRYREALARAHEELDALRLKGACNMTLDCGGTCYLHKGHKSPCLCTGDTNGEPGTCPA